MFCFWRTSGRSPKTRKKTQPKKRKEHGPLEELWSSREKQWERADFSSRCQLLHLANKYFIPAACFGLRRRMLLIGSQTNVSVSAWVTTRCAPPSPPTSGLSWMSDFATELSAPRLTCRSSGIVQYAHWSVRTTHLASSLCFPSFILIVSLCGPSVRLLLPVPVFFASLSVLAPIVLTCVPLHSCIYRLCVLALVSSSVIGNTP